MSEGWTDPGSLEGDALAQWYLRSPADIERARQAAAARGYQDFFYGSTASAPGSSRGVPASSQDIDPGFSVPAPSADIDPGFTWAQMGPNRWRSVTTVQQSASPSLPTTSFDNDDAPTDGALRSNASYRSPASTPPLNNSLRPAQGTQTALSGQPAAIDPSKTPVFQTGADGKLHPVPGWHTTGPFDFGTWSHNIHWGGVAKDLGEIGAGVATFFSGAGLGADLLSALGPEAETAVAEGIADSPAAKAAADAIHSRHLDPKYMGGAANGERVDLEGRLHRAFHSMLGKAHGEAGFPPVGGISGSAKKWAEHYRLKAGSRDEAMAILRRVSREFDQTYGTNISSKLQPVPEAGEVGTSPPD